MTIGHWSVRDKVLHELTFDLDSLHEAYPSLDAPYTTSLTAVIMNSCGYNCYL